MATIGRFAFAGVSTAVEVTNALASINIDFSLVKIEPPQEFRDVGLILAPKRRDTAEDGTLHITARRLGAIFDSILPQTPQLIKSYGLRASEISRSSVQNSPAVKGIFSQQTGIDAASVWAGATSGSGAIQVHLLACMLARMWTGPEAISIWAELLNCRRMRLEDEFKNTGTMDVRTMVAAKQQIDRAQLAEWDGSARAWLRIADLAKNLQHKQLLLILGNLDKTVNSKPILYDSVINAWTTGMEGMEALLQGSPMMMQTGDMALALSSWHIYPDLNIVSISTKVVRQNDSLVPPSGILTIGLEGHGKDSSKGLQWSLPLAHLRYYGDPVTRISELTVQGSRLSLLEFDMAVLGCVLGVWGVPDCDNIAIIRWISKLSEFMPGAYSGESAILKHTWLPILGNTASAFLRSTDIERQRFTKLLHLGRGRRSFISDSGPPFFGLSRLDRVIRMVKTSELRVSILRAQAEQAGIEFEHAIIRYVSDSSGQEEFASAVPHRRITPKRPNPENNNPQSKESVGHIRWANQGLKYIMHEVESVITADVSVMFSGKMDEELRSHADAEKVKSIRAAQMKTEDAFQQATHLYQAMGEEVLSTEREPIETFSGSGSSRMRVVWGQAQGGHNMDKYEHWFGPIKHHEYWIGDVKTAAIFLRLDQDPAVPGGEARISFQKLQTLFDQDAINSAVFAREILDGTAPGRDKVRFTESLRAYATMHSLYSRLNQATVDVRVFGMPLNEKHWAANVLTDNPTDKLSARRYEHSGESSSVVPNPSDGGSAGGRASPGDTNGNASKLGGFIGTDQEEPPSEETQEESFQDAMEMLEAAAPEKATPPSPVLQADATVEDILPVMGPVSITLEQSFSCILLFESAFDIAPRILRNVMAISSGNSLFIASSLLSDPHSLPANREISHVMGNIGRPGTVLMVPPIRPRMMAPGIERWPFMNFRDWDGVSRDSFAESSLHLWFTASTQEINVGYSGAHDKELYMVESVVSLHGKGEWVADLDILKALQSSELVYRQRRSVPPGYAKGERQSTVCQENHIPGYKHRRLPLVTIETWWELLEKSSNDCVFLAADNWQARLAAMIICLVQGRRVSLVSNPVCWDCVADAKRTIPELKNPVVYIY